MATTTTEATPPPETTTVPESSTTSSTQPTFSLEPGDVLISGSAGVRITRGSDVVTRAVTEPAQFALAIGDGRLVFQAPPEGVYPDYWPTTEPMGDPTIRIAAPDGSVEVLYQGGGSIRMFDVVEIPEVHDGPVVLAMRFDPLADGSHVESILMIPVDGSAAFVVADVPSHVTGAAWMGDFLVISVATDDGTSYLAAIGLDGQEVTWPLNPEPIGERDADTRITTLARLGDTPLIAYTVASGGFWEGLATLIIYDTEVGAAATLDIGIPQMVITALHGSDTDLAVSKVYETGDRSGWSLIHVPITVYDTSDWTLRPLSIPGGGTHSVVGSG